MAKQPAFGLVRVNLGLDHGAILAIALTLGGFVVLQVFLRHWYRNEFTAARFVLAAPVASMPGKRVALADCTSPANAIVAENCRPGSDGWDIAGAGDSSIQGFAAQFSVKAGDVVEFKVKTDAAAYRFDIYRLGYYGGHGARKIATLQPSAPLPQRQPNCLYEEDSGLVDCGNWAVSGLWRVPADATSGIYFARLVREDTGGASHIVFVVRDDLSHSDLLFQTSDTTWQAYNDYGGHSLYAGGPGTNPPRAYKVSYNRPFNTRAVDGGHDWLFSAEYPMVRWLEANGYSVSYASGADIDRDGEAIRRHRIFLSVGHDEYWSGRQRANVEAARDAGIHLAFFSGNEIFWKTRWEESIDGSGTPYRTLAAYKETHSGPVPCPVDADAWTGTWRDPRCASAATGRLPENALSGTIFMINDGPRTTTSITVPADEGRMRFWRNTSIARQEDGEIATLPMGTLGYEWDVDADNGFRPAGLLRLSSTTVEDVPVLRDSGSVYTAGSATHSMTLYRHSSGALVFSAGTVQWSWGLDASHDPTGSGSHHQSPLARLLHRLGADDLVAGSPDARMQQATVNLLADMGAQPAALQSGLLPATPSSDTLAPTSSIGFPQSGARLPAGIPLTIIGTASDRGGVVGGVEVSTDDGKTWRPARGRNRWSYVWIPEGDGHVSIRSRAIDDSGNIENPGSGISIDVAGHVPATSGGDGA